MLVSFGNTVKIFFLNRQLAESLKCRIGGFMLEFIFHEGFAALHVWSNSQHIDYSQKILTKTKNLEF